ncbi:hypothetical protein D3C72_2127690 [compost metagenome]
MRVLRQTAFKVSHFRQAGSLAQEGQLGLGTGQCSFVFVSLDRIQHGLRFAQLTTLGQAAGIQDQRLGIAVVLTQQRL